MKKVERISTRDTALQYKSQTPMPQLSLNQWPAPSPSSSIIGGAYNNLFHHCTDPDICHVIAPPGLILWWHGTQTTTAECPDVDDDIPHSSSSASDANGRNHSVLGNPSLHGSILLNSWY